MGTLANNICDFLISGMLGTSVHVYLRHRWSGIEIAADQLGLLASCHGLLRPAYISFTLHFMKVPPLVDLHVDTWGVVATVDPEIEDVGSDGSGDEEQQADAAHLHGNAAVQLPLQQIVAMDDPAAAAAGPASAGSAPATAKNETD